MKLISSTENKGIKAFQRLTHKKYRDSESRFIIEGVNLFLEANYANALENVFFDESASESQEIKKCMNICEKNNIESNFLTSKIFKMLADTDSPQGVIAIVKKKRYNEGLIEPSKSNILVLDKIQDPGNLGNIIRTADAAGIDEIILIKGTTDEYSQKVVRAAAGSIFRVPMSHIESVSDCIKILKERKKKIICTSPYAKIIYTSLDMVENIAIIIGNEANGVSEDFIINADFTVSIPMKKGAESLNAATSAGILMYEAVRQKGTTHAE